MNLLVTGGWYESKDHLDEIREIGYDVYFLEKESDELPCDAAIIDGIVCCKVFNWHPIEEFTRLKFIQTESVGYDRVPTEYCKEHNIQVFNVGNTYAEPMSEYVIGHLLSWYQNMGQEIENQANRGWVKNRKKKELAGKTVCIVGTGNIAKYTAKKLLAFGCKVIGISHTVREVEFISEVRFYDSLLETIRESDVIILATPPAGKPAIGASELSVMKKTAILVNVSRGQQIDEKALIQTLKKGSIEAAIMDVFTEEPLPEDSELWKLDNVIITPHSSYIGEGNAERLWQTIKHNLENKMA